MATIKVTNGSDFDDVEESNLHLAQADGWHPVKNDISLTESAVRGAAQGASFGFADEAAGAMEALVDKLGGVRPTPEQEKTFRELYQQHRDESRAAFKAAEEANPKTFLAGGLAGSVAPALLTGGAGAIGAAAKGAASLSNAGKAAALAKAMGQGVVSGAKYGAVSGLGVSEADLTEGNAAGAIEDVGKGMASGAVIGGLAPPALKLAGGALKAAAHIPKRAIEKVSEIAKDSVFGEQAGQVMQRARDALPTFGRKGRELVEDEVVDVARKAQDSFIDDAQRLGDAIGARLKAAEEEGVVVDFPSEMRKGIELLGSMKGKGHTSEDIATAKQLLLDAIETKLKPATATTRVVRDADGNIQHTESTLSSPPGVKIPEASGLAKPLEKGSSGKVDPMSFVAPESVETTSKARLSSVPHPETGDIVPVLRNTDLARGKIPLSAAKPERSLTEMAAILKSLTDTAHKKDTPVNDLVLQALRPVKEEFRETVGGIKEPYEKLRKLHEIRKNDTGYTPSSKEINTSLVTLIKKMASPDAEKNAEVSNFLTRLRAYDPVKAESLIAEMKNKAKASELIKRIQTSEPMSAGGTVLGMGVGAALGGGVPGALLGGAAQHVLGSGRTHLLRAAYLGTRAAENVKAGVGSVVAKATDIAKHFQNKPPEFLQEASKAVLSVPGEEGAKKSLSKILAEAGGRNAIGRTALIYTIMQNKQYKDLLNKVYPNMASDIAQEKTDKENAPKE